MCYKSNLKTTSKFKRSTNFDNFWKKKIYLKKLEKHLKGIDLSKRLKLYTNRNFVLCNQGNND
jgi:hypothetical protein